MSEEIKINRIQFVEHRETKVTDEYSIKKQLGDGVSGAVFLGQHKQTGETRAIKQILKSRLAKSVREAREEIDILKRLDHPNIIKLIETYEDEKSIFLVTEVCQGGELFDAIVDLEYISEAQACRVFQQIARAVCYMH
jgi:calcium-dependent protein kinase